MAIAPVATVLRGMAGGGGVVAMMRANQITGSGDRTGLPPPISCGAKPSSGNGVGTTKKTNDKFTGVFLISSALRSTIDR